MISWLVNRFSPLRRSPARQQQVDEETGKLSLYHHPLCGYCLRVRRFIWRNNLKIEQRNTQKVHWQQELRQQGGKSQVPCLRIDHQERVEWLYESADIIYFLKQSYGNGTDPSNSHQAD